MSVHILEPHDSYAALKPARLAWYGAPPSAGGQRAPYPQPSKPVPATQPQTQSRI